MGFCECVGGGGEGVMGKTLMLMHHAHSRLSFAQQDFWVQFVPEPCSLCCEKFRQHAHPEPVNQDTSEQQVPCMI